MQNQNTNTPHSFRAKYLGYIFGALIALDVALLIACAAFGIDRFASFYADYTKVRQDMFEANAGVEPKNDLGLSRLQQANDSAARSAPLHVEERR